jgi:hypothetical protein
MMKTSLLAPALLLATTAAAHAGGQAGSIGVGAEFQLSGVGGISANYDGGRFHTGLAIGFADPDGPNNSVFDLFGRFYFHVASTATADFGIGGSIGLQTQGRGAVAGTDTNVFLEPGFQIRVFVASNVALSFAGGITIGIADANDVAITAQGLNGLAGVHYYFF